MHIHKHTIIHVHIAQFQETIHVHSWIHFKKPRKAGRQPCRHHTKCSASSYKHPKDHVLKGPCISTNTGHFSHRLIHMSYVQRNVVTATEVAVQCCSVLSALLMPLQHLGVHTVRMLLTWCHVLCNQLQT